MGDNKERKRIIKKGVLVSKDKTLKNRSIQSGEYASESIKREKNKSDKNVTNMPSSTTPPKKNKKEE